jgi:hypothetical protein
MSLCYDFQKWTVLTLPAVLTVCIIGLVNLAYGQDIIKGGACLPGTDKCFEFYAKYSLQYNQLTQYCIDHADKIINGQNPVQDLVNASLIPMWFNNKSCDQVNHEVEAIKELNMYLTDPNAYQELIENHSQPFGEEWWRK